MYYKQCPRFNKCSVNCCPLDPDQDERPSMAGDPQTKCKLDRDTRWKIGKDSDLPRRGLTKREWGNKKAAETRWKKPEERKKAIERMANIRTKRTRISGGA